MRIVRVALPVPLPQLFDYQSEDACDEDLGRCVRVPFGRTEKSGLIVALPPVSDIDAARLRQVRHIQRDVPPLPADWLALAAFAARYYHAPLGEIIALALPPGLRRADSVSGADNDPLLTVSALGHAALAESRRASRALALLRQALSGALPARLGVLRALPDGAAVRDALRRGWLEAADGAEESHACVSAPALTAGQAAALASIEAAPPGFCAWLLHGVTGSGKPRSTCALRSARLRQGGRC